MSTWPECTHRSTGSVPSVPGYMPGRPVFMHGESNFMTEMPGSMSGVPASRRVWTCSMFGH